MNHPEVKKINFAIISLLGGLAACLIFLPTLDLVRQPALAAADLPVYTDSLADGWADWSWDVTASYTNSAPVHTGSASIAVTFSQGWDGLQFGYHGENLDISAYDTFRFWVHGGAEGGQQITLQLGSLEQVITPTANTWSQVDISLLPLGYPRSVYSIVWFNNTPNSQFTFYLDDIAFVDTGVPTPTPPPPSPGPALSVDAAAGIHSISPYIYGMNFVSEALAAELHLPVRRWGGNSTSRYNWQIDTTNTGSDWYYENIPQENGAADLFIEQDRRTGTKTIMTIPLIGWVAKRRLDNHPYDCGYKVSVYGAQPDTDPWDTDCGNGVLTNGASISGNDPHDTSVEITSGFATQWVSHLVNQFGTAEDGGVMFYNLDNEPMLWYETHRDVHPNPTSYDEMRDQTWDYAAAIKAGDPSAQTLGPVVWGWTAYFWSALDWESGTDWWNHPQDRLAHGDIPFIEWYLQQMAAYQQQHGMRILDFLDIHYYPQANGVALALAGNTATQALRLRSTRSLWDPTYADESWIGQAAAGPYVQLIPRMKAWVNNNYPNTKLAITEYNWGGLEHINGALTQADVLGIFGRENLDLATLWGPPDANEPGAFAFRMYRNYDGTGSTFGETSIAAASADQERLAIYASARASDGALTLIILNKTQTPLTSTLALANFDPAGTAQIYRYSAANLNTIVHQPDQVVTTGGFTATFPAESITLVVIPPASFAPPKKLYLPLICSRSPVIRQ